MAVVVIGNNTRPKYESIITSDTSINKKYIRTQYCCHLKTIIKNIFTFLEYEIRYSVENPNFNKLDIIAFHDKINRKVVIKVKHTFINRRGYISIYTSENAVKICNRTDGKTIDRLLARVYLYIRQHDYNKDVLKTYINNRLMKYGPENAIVINNYDHLSHWPEYFDKIPVSDKTSYVVYLTPINRYR